MLNKYERAAEMFGISGFFVSNKSNKKALPKKEVVMPVAFGKTDRGLVRPVNEDGYVINERLGLYLVVDGMGGHVNGVIATQMIVNLFQSQLELFIHRLPTNGDITDSDYAEYLDHVIVQVNSALYEKNKSRGDTSGQGMGAVVAGLWWIEPGRRALVFHVGDSRLYRYRQQELTQLTVDHSVYQLWLMRGGEGEPPSRSAVFRAIGPHPEVVADIQLVDFDPQDKLLLCSDGLSNMLSDEELAIMVANANSTQTLEALPGELIRQANTRGGHDNITALVVGLNAG